MNKDLQELPVGWVRTTLGEVADITSGGTPRRTVKEYWGGSIPWLKISDIPEDGRVYETKETITQLGLDESSAKIFPRRTILFSIFATIGKVGILEIEAATNQAICGITPKHGVDVKFAFYYLRHTGKTLLNRTHGITQRNINTSILKSMPFLLAPKREQKRIVARIDQLLESVKNAEKHVSKVQPLLSQFRESLFNESFHNATPSPLENHATLFNGKAVGSGNSNIRVFKTRHVYPTGLRMDKPSFLKPEQEKKITPQRFLKSGDVLIVNTWQNLGRVCYVDEPGENWTVDTQIMIVRPKAGNFGKYLFYFFSSKRGYELLLNCEKGALTAGPSRKLTHIYPKDVRKIPIPYFPPEKQRIIISRIDSILKKISEVGICANNVEAEIKQIEQALLLRAFKGDLVSQDPNDEPASILLERIKAITPKTKKRRKIRRLPKGQKVLVKQFSTIRAYLEENNGQATIEQVLEASALTLDDFWDKLKSEMDHGQVRKVQKGKSIFLTVRV